MKNKTITTNYLLIVLLGLGVSGTSHAAILAFDGGYSNNTAVSSLVSGTYGSDISSNSTEFVTTDSFGATPNINLLWDAGSDFEFHSDTRWQAIGDQSGTESPLAILQLNQNQSDRTITFTPDTGYAVEFGSVDFGFGTGMNAADSVGTVDIITDFGLGTQSTVMTVSTATLARGSAETLDLSFTGAVDEVYTLQFTSSVNENWGAIDDLSFGQIPEPSTALLGALGLLALLRRRR